VTYAAEVVVREGVAARRWPLQLLRSCCTLHLMREHTDTCTTTSQQ